MAYIRLIRSRQTLSYYLVENTRDPNGQPRQRKLCYLGRVEDGTDTLEKALAHWKQVKQELAREFRTAKSARKPVLKRKQAAVAARTGLLAELIQIEAAAQEAKRKHGEEAVHWEAIEQLYWEPTAENFKAAKRAYRQLAMRLHPDQGGSHEAFIKLQAAYERAEKQWQWLAA
ncbi:hypothetical protein [Paludisphaera borealis]|uniref:hypothetical protein n=1 Tax=Paludisphaera borealis TaxID=1387353 RepID=UPI0009703605|nr:hypothetical protein [Paludisphaera borealis]